MSIIGPETSEFRDEFTRQTDRLLRRRLVLFISIWGGLSVLGMLSIIVLIVVDFVTGGKFIATLMQAFSELGPGRAAVFGLTTFAWYAGYGSALFVVLKRRNIRTDRVVHLSIGLIMLDGLLVIVLRAADVPFYNLTFFWISHFVACAVFPWTVRQAVAPVVVILLLSGLTHWTIEGTSALQVMVLTLVAAVLFVPAIINCWARNSRRMQLAAGRFVRERYGTLRRELANARQIHEALFPKPETRAGLRFDYRYEPMRQIGGDYLYARFRYAPRIDRYPPTDGIDRDAPDRFDLLVLDVTGHGLAAALTVNRLYGEVERLFAENPGIGPGEVLRALNRYVHLTLAPHSIFATAMCARVDLARDELEFASGGHPPAFLRTADGRIDRLGSTSFLLGACSDDEFEPSPRVLRFEPGDTLIAYTDGATEVRDDTGSMLGLRGLEALVAGAPKSGIVLSWAQAILSAVDGHRRGPAEDDVLIVELCREPCRRPGLAVRDVAEHQAAARRRSEGDAADERRSATVGS